MTDFASRYSLSLCASAKPGKISEAAFNLTQILISILKSFNFNQVNLVVVLLKSKGVIYILAFLVLYVLKIRKNRDNPVQNSSVQRMYRVFFTMQGHH